MIQVATFHKYPRFCETSLHFSQCSGGQEIDSQTNKELKKMCGLEITSNWNKDCKFSKFLIVISHPIFKEIIIIVIEDNNIIVF